MSDDLTEFTTEIADQVDSFVLAVREIAAGESPDHAISLLLLEVSQLMLAGGRLGAIQDVVPEERFEPDAGFDPDVEGIRTSLAQLLKPIDDYTEVFDPLAAEVELTHGHLSDDIASITSDLLHGLAHFRAGRALEALWWWQFSYLSNWGGTAGSVLRTLQSVVSHVRLDSGVDDEVAAEDQLLAQTAANAVVASTAVDPVDPAAARTDPAHPAAPAAGPGADPAAGSGADPAAGSGADPAAGSGADPPPA